MTDDLTARAKAALEGVTEGPWVLDRHDEHDNDKLTVGAGEYLTSPYAYRSTDLIYEVDTYSDVFDEPHYQQRLADARFIAAARTLVPELLAEIERLHKGCDHIEELGQALAEVERLRGALETVEARNLRQFETIDRARFGLGRAWDDGNACGLDGWTGPGRGAGEIDDEAIRQRERCIEAVLRGDQ